MAKELTFKTEAGEIVLTRPTFGQMRKIGDDLSHLYEAESAQALLFSDTFDGLIKAVAKTPADYKRVVDEATLEEVWQLWTEFVEFARLDPLFEEVEAAHQDRLWALQRSRIERQMEQIEEMKKQGLVPEDFSLKDAVKGQLGEIDLNQMTSGLGSKRPKPKAGSKK